jgi:sigma-B regulation protein RsbU (phosphoserine phosphatase)
VNDVILLFTDGLFEVENSAHEEYGQERLLDAVRRNASLHSEGLFDALLAEVQRFSSRNVFEDDVCLVGLEVKRVNGTRQ